MDEPARIRICICIGMRAICCMRAIIHQSRASRAHLQQPRQDVNQPAVPKKEAVRRGGHVGEEADPIGKRGGDAQRPFL